MDCERNIELTSEEVKNLMIRVQKFNSIINIFGKEGIVWILCFTQSQIHLT